MGGCATAHSPFFVCKAISEMGDIAMTDTYTYEGEQSVVWKTFLPEGIDKAPETVEEALIAGRALLAEEGRWLQGKWFDNQDPHVDPDTPFCNSWQVCAEGAISSVVVGAAKIETLSTSLRSYLEDGQLWGFKPELLRVTDPERKDLYEKAVNALRFGQHVGSRGVAASQFNDATGRTREEVLAWFDKAIECERAYQQNQRYEAEAAAARDAAERAYDEAQAAYRTARNKAYAEQDKAIDPAREAYNKATREANVAYQAAVEAARQANRAVISEAAKAYSEASQQTRAVFEDAVKAERQAVRDAEEARNKPYVVLAAIERATAQGQVYVPESEETVDA